MGLRTYRSKAARTRALDDWLHRYNHHRHHPAVGATYQPCQHPGCAEHLGARVNALTTLGDGREEGGLVATFGIAAHGAAFAISTPLQLSLRGPSPYSLWSEGAAPTAAGCREPNQRLRDELGRHHGFRSTSPLAATTSSCFLVRAHPVRALGRVRARHEGGEASGSTWRRARRAATELSVPRTAGYRSGGGQLMPTTGMFSGVPPIDPRNGALKAKIPPSEATSQ